MPVRLPCSSSFASAMFGMIARRLGVAHPHLRQLGVDGEVAAHVGLALLGVGLVRLVVGLGLVERGLQLLGVACLGGELLDLLVALLQLGLEGLHLLLVLVGLALVLRVGHDLLLGLGLLAFAALVSLGLVVFSHRLLLPCLVVALPRALGWPTVVAVVACGACCRRPIACLHLPRGVARQKKRPPVVGGLDAVSLFGCRCFATGRRCSPPRRWVSR